MLKISLRTKKNIGQKEKTGIKPQSTPNTSFIKVIQYLHQTIGNQVVSNWIQTKLKIGQPNDKYEKEADRIAEKIMTMPSSTCASYEEERLQPKLIDEISPIIQRQETEEEEEKEIIQPKRITDEGEKEIPEIETYISRTRGLGNSLPPGIRAFMEERFGVDFSNVRIHADSEAARMARALNAEAFTYGRDIYFGEGRYRPETTEGKKLLAHELTHVVQQSRGNRSKKIQLYQSKICGRDSTQFKDFPKTYIKQINIDLGSRKLKLEWEGPNKNKGQKGPFKISAGAGKCGINCDDETQSRLPGSLCTPKGDFTVKKFLCVMPGVSFGEIPVKNATYFNLKRKIAIHSTGGSVPEDNISHGCVRVEDKASEVIYDNSIKNRTKVHIFGKWDSSCCYEDWDKLQNRNNRQCLYSD